MLPLPRRWEIPRWGEPIPLKRAAVALILYAESAIAEMGSLISLGILVFPWEETKE